MNTAQEDDCCKPLRADLFNKQSWICTKCGCEWRPVMIGPLRHWQPVVVFAVLPAPGSAALE